MRGAGRAAADGVPPLPTRLGALTARSRATRELDDLDAVFAALAHESRRHILQVLRARGTMSAGDIAARFSCSWPTTTGHLRQLEEAGLVRVEKVGRERRYSVAVDHLLEIADLWLTPFRD